MNAGAFQRTPARLKRVLSRAVAKTTETVLPSRVVDRMRAARDWGRWVDSLAPDLLQPLADTAPDELKRRLFKANVTRVEIETHARCNRVCSFCPNATADRRRDATLADAAMLDRVFDELGSIDYRRQICVSRYSEPLTNREYLYERLRSARARVPHAELAITTNTDYLTPAVLGQLRDCGLDVVYMSLYLRNGERWSLDLAHAYSTGLARKLGTPIVESHDSPTSVACTYSYDGLRLTSTCHDWNGYGTDRGGTVKLYRTRERVGPCRNPFDTFVIDCNGSVMPCCNLRNDLPEHREFVVGDLSQPETSIFDVYAGQLAGWRGSLVSFGKLSFPCATCRHREVPAGLVPEIARRVGARLSLIGRSDLHDTRMIP